LGCFDRHWRRGGWEGDFHATVSFNVFDYFHVVSIWLSMAVVSNWSLDAFGVVLHLVE
jgi:hypothetical protein